LYVEPFYIQGQASSTSFPQLNRVLVWYAGRVGVGQTLTQALTRAAQSAPVQTPAVGDAGTAETDPGTDQGLPTDTSTTTPAVPPADAAAAVTAMDAAASELDAAKASGDLGQIGAASQKLEDAVKAYLTLVDAQQPSASLGPVPSSGG